MNNHAHIIRAIQEKADDHFIKAWFDQANISGYITGAAQPKLSQDNLKRIEILLPPLPIQRKIATVLSAYDELIENNTRRIKILEEMAQAIYREWFVYYRFSGYENIRLVDTYSELGIVPEGWEIVTVGDLYDTGSGGTPSRTVPDYYGGNIKWVKTRELNDRFIIQTEETITELGLKKSSAKVFPTNTVIMAMYGATIGKLGILSSPMSTNQACCAILQKKEPFGYSYAYLSLLENREKIISLGMGAAQQNISQIVIRGYQMLKPNEEVVSEFNNIIEPLQELIRVLQNKNINLQASRDFLLPQLISGELDVSELDIHVHQI